MHTEIFEKRRLQAIGAFCGLGDRTSKEIGETISLLSKLIIEAEKSKLYHAIFKLQRKYSMVLNRNKRRSLYLIGD